ncbi:MAG: hypothetical protein B6D39_06260 [Anaerolineae bacterium UTCFX2]|nr:MAG: hypothetical protein B6D39_06260 [Anaerolineae bacterium UTCFX2]
MMRNILILMILALAACSATVSPVEPPQSPAATPLAAPTAAEIEINPDEPGIQPSAALASATPVVEPPAVGSPTAIPLEPALKSSPTLFIPRIENTSEYAWQPLAVRFAKPVGIENAGDGSGRLFIVEQAGRIQVLQAGSPLSEVFLDLTDRVGSRGFEQGLLGLAFHPNYSENGYFYVNYTDLQGNTVIARFQVSAQDVRRAAPESELILMQVQQPYVNHNGGSLAFGPDGYLYLGLGDGGSQGDPQNRAQSTDTRLGKILRIDVDHGDPYAIPAGNPFSTSGGVAEIWAIGLRNPWRMSFDRLTGDLYIGDVGQNQWEEIDFLSADQIRQGSGSQPFNFGWRYYEGNHAYTGTPPQNLDLIPPVAEYSHQFGCSVAGGVVYRGAELPAWQGIYLYGDYCSGTVWGLWHMPFGGGWENRLLFENLGQITTFGEDERGEIYLADHSGLFYRLTGK